MTIIPIIILIIIALMIIINFTSNSNEDKNIPYNNTNTNIEKVSYSQNNKAYNRNEFAKMIEQSFYISAQNAIKSTHEKFGKGEDSEFVLRIILPKAIEIKSNQLKKEFINDPVANSLFTNKELIEIIEKSRQKIYNLFF